MMNKMGKVGKMNGMFEAHEKMRASMQAEMKKGITCEYVTKGKVHKSYAKGRIGSAGYDTGRIPDEVYMTQNELFEKRKSMKENDISQPFK